MQLTFNFEDGATPKDIAAKLRFQASLLLGVDPKKAASRENTDEDMDDEEDEDEELAPKKKGGKKAKPAADFDDDAEDEETEDDDSEETESDDEDAEEEEDEEPAPKKKAKGKKLTVADVNEACKARAKATGGKEGRAEVLGILKKKFKTQSVSDLKPEDFAAVIKAMAV